MKLFITVNSVLLLLFGSMSGQAASYYERADVQQFIDAMVSQHDYPESELVALFKSVQEQKQVARAIKAPAERKKKWHQYRAIFMTQSRIKNGIKFWTEHETILQQAEQHYGVPAEIIVAIIGVETFYGKHTGKHPVFASLVTLGFGETRSKFFRSELEHFLLLCLEEGMDPASLSGSYAGAMGLGQFISSSYRHYSVDADNDGKRDLWTSSEDIIHSVANYFRQHGWREQQGITQQIERALDSGQIDTSNTLKPKFSVAALRAQGFSINSDLQGPVSLIVLDQQDRQEYWLGQHNFYVITRYNHSHMYAMAVYQLSQEIKGQWTSLLADDN